MHLIQLPTSSEIISNILNPIKIEYILPFIYGNILVQLSFDNANLLLQQETNLMGLQPFTKLENISTQQKQMNAICEITIQHIDNKRNLRIVCERNIFYAYLHQGFYYYSNCDPVFVFMKSTSKAKDDY